MCMLHACSVCTCIFCMHVWLFYTSDLRLAGSGSTPRCTGSDAPEIREQRSRIRSTSEGEQRTPGHDSIGELASACSHTISKKEPSRYCTLVSF